MINKISLRLLYLNFGHFIDHMLILIFAKAAFSAGIDFGFGKDGAYAEMLFYGIPSLVLFGACAPIAAHMADHWNRNGMLTVFFVGIGLASILTGFAQSLLQIGLGLGLIGIFASIYHPVGIAMVIEGGGKVGWRLGVNGLWGNMGVAAAPLVTGLILVQFDWRMAFIIPGSISILIGLGFLGFVRSVDVRAPEAIRQEKELIGFAPGWQRALVSLALVTAAGGFVFGAMTFLIPRLFEVRMQGITSDIAVTGTLASIIYAVAAFAQLVVGRAIDKRSIKNVLIFIAVGQPLLLFLMAMQTDYALFAVSLLAMGFVFGQIPITDAVLSQYVPDQWRAKVLSIKFLINLVIGALALMTARYLLSTGAGFEAVMRVISIAACFIVGAAILLPNRHAFPTVKS
ncbi:MAG: MFS transporter [SAR324 cluster bacterium]|nr:MFS transporter [SAR324 cluster bacterium]